MDYIIITRHEALVNFLHDRFGIIGKVVAHATKEDVKGKDVVGILPLSLAVHARTLTNVDMDIPVDMRGKELSLEQIEKFFKGLEVYVVKTKKGFNASLEDATDAGYHGMPAPQLG